MPAQMTGCRGESDRKCLAAEPNGDILRKERSQGLIDTGVVNIKPSKLICRQQLRKDCCCVEMAKGQCLKLVPFPELRYTGILA